MTIKAALLTPHLYLGGPRGWMLDLLTRSRRIHWLGVACLHEAWVDSRSVQMLQSVTRVYGFEPAAIRNVLDADVLVAWGVQNLDQILPEDYRGRVVFVSKGADADFTRPAIVGGLGGVTHWVAASSSALPPFDGLVDRARITIIPNGINPEHCRPALPRTRARRLLGFRENEIVCAFVGRHSAEKRPVLLAQALTALPPKYRGLWVGTGPEEARNRAEIARLLNGRAVFVPPLDAVGTILAAADVIVAPSLMEGFCYTFCEALYCQVPLIATATGILPTIEGQLGQRCWTQVPTDATGEQLARAIQQTVLLAPSERQRRAELGRSIVHREYLAATMVERWEAYLAAIW